MEDVTLSTGESVADVAHLITSLSTDWQPGTVGELKVSLADPDNELLTHGMCQLGTVLTWQGSDWQLGAVDRTLTETGAMIDTRWRSQLGKRLRAGGSASATRNVSPGEWIERSVRSLGGRAVAERGARRRTIVRRRGQSTLDVIASLAESTGVEWVESDGLMVVGTPWWALQGGPGLPTWRVTWMQDPATDATAMSGTITDDSRTDAATMSLTVPRSVAEPLRPWHRIEVDGAGDPLDGDWLVGGVALDWWREDAVSLEVSRPLRSAPKAGSAPAKPSVSKPTTSKPTTSKPTTSKPSVSKPPATRPSSPGTPSARPGSYAGAVRHPFGGRRFSGHTYDGHGGATDYPMPLGTPLYAPRAGYVISCRGDVRNHASGGPAKKWPGDANYVLLGIMLDGRPARILFWHLSPGLAVSRRQWVASGQLLGRSGNTGHSTGPHTHIQAAWGHRDSAFGGPIIYPASRVWS